VSSQFPRGYNTGLDWGDWQEGDVTLWTPNEEKPLTKKCECGIWITMGENCDLKFHSDWCPIKENEKM